MNFKIFGKQVKVGQSFTKYAKLNLFDAVTKFFPNAVSSIVSVSKKNKIFSAIDNLVKGASGQAIQNMNLVYGFQEHLGLK